MGNKQKPSNSCEIIEKNVFNTTEWHENITALDLSNREITNFDESVKLPLNLILLNLSNNNFTEVPKIVLKLNSLKTLNLSFNKIVLFDETPNFCHTLESLNLSKNKLEGPPYWVWAEQPKNLVYLNLSNNGSLCQSFENYYFQELLQYTTLVTTVDLHSCRLHKHMKLISTFKHAKVVSLGNSDYDYLSVNHIENVPCIGLEDCNYIEVLNLCNTNIYNVQHNIDIYKNLKEINLSQNNINSLPNEFCYLVNMEICILSFNKILYLPEDIHKLQKLKKLSLDNNNLCMVPETLRQLEDLESLDLYNNYLYEGLCDISHLEEYDFARNYGDEPNNDEYLKKKDKLRENCSGRENGRAPEPAHEETEPESDIESNHEDSIEPDLNNDVSRCSSPEDWDSDDFWIPSPVDICNQNDKRTSSSSSARQWLDFVQRKMDEGNFCPMDMHLTISITEMVRHEKLNNPQPQYESDGQFDDYSGDEV